VEPEIPNPILDFTAAAMPVAPSTVQKKGERGVTGDLVEASEPDPEPEFDVGEVGEDNIRFCATLKRLWVFRLDSSVAEATNVTDVFEVLFASAFGPDSSGNDFPSDDLA